MQPGQTTGEMRVIESGLKPDERVVVAGILDAVPGQKVNSQLQVPKSTTAEIAIAARPISPSKRLLRMIRYRLRYVA